MSSVSITYEIRRENKGRGSYEYRRRISPRISTPFVRAGPPESTPPIEKPFALACYWAVVYSELIVTSGIDLADGATKRKIAKENVGRFDFS